MLRRFPWWLALGLLGACGGGDDTRAVREVACRRLSTQPLVEVLRDDAAGRTWSLTLARPESTRPETSLGTITTSGGWVLRGATVRSPGVPESPIRTRLDATGGTGTVSLTFAAPPSVDPEPKQVDLDVQLEFAPNSIGPGRFAWQAALPIGPCD